MFRYSTIYIYVISFIISITLFFILQFIFSNIDVFTQKSSFKAGFTVEQNQLVEPKEKLKKETEESKEVIVGRIEIPKIELIAPIAEGTKNQTMEHFVGHFEETSKWEGNIGLAAHNRGYEKNYFEKIKQLKEGDMILYFYQDKNREYKVKKQAIVKDTNWAYLEPTEENQITLITCVENEPNYRRCVQAIENK